jgi:hypothetical protein
MNHSLSFVTHVDPLELFLGVVLGHKVTLVKLVSRLSKHYSWSTNWLSVWRCYEENNCNIWFLSDIMVKNIVKIIAIIIFSNLGFFRNGQMDALVSREFLESVENNFICLASPPRQVDAAKVDTICDSVLLAPFAYSSFNYNSLYCT